MGLLTQSSAKEGLLSRFLTLHSTKLCFLSYIAGIVWFGFLCWDPYNARTYFSESALLPGLVQREFTAGSATNQLYESLQEDSKKRPSLPYSWLLGQFRQLGLEVYTHNFTLHYPFGPRPAYYGKNVYAILRASRAASTEALVLSTPYRGPDSAHGTTLPGVALMISLASFFIKHPYWAKDIIFLVTEYELVGFQAWLEAYHDAPSSLKVLDCGHLEGRSGAIQAAINLEIHSDRISHFDIKVEGLNGQLPNLDLFNLVVEMCVRESVTPTFHFKLQPAEFGTWSAWKENAWVMASMMMMQATGLPSGAHGLFHRYSIQALTLEGHTTNFGGAPRASFVNMGRVLEGTFRSLNNLLERFHQSFFFYLLPSTRRYVSIGMYMPPFCLIAAPLLLKALGLYLSFSSTASKSNSKEVAAAAPTEEKQPNFLAAFPVVVFSHILGVLFCMAPEALNWVGKRFSLPVEGVFYNGMAALAIASLLAYNKCLSSHNSSLYKYVALIDLGLVLYTLSLINISMATILALIYVPVAVTARGTKSRILSWLHLLLLLIIHPFVLTFLCVLINSVYIDPNTTVTEHLVRSWKGHRKVILFGIEDWYLYNNWGYPAACVFLFPAWMELWTLPKAV